LGSAPKAQDGFLSFSEFSSGALLLYQDALEDELHVLFSSNWEMVANKHGLLENPPFIK